MTASAVVVKLITVQSFPWFVVGIIANGVTQRSMLNADWRKAIKRKTSMQPSTSLQPLRSALTDLYKCLFHFPDCQLLRIGQDALQAFCFRQLIAVEKPHGLEFTFVKR